MEKNLFHGFLVYFTLSHTVHFGNDNLYNGKSREILPVFYLLTSKQELSPFSVDTSNPGKGIENEATAYISSTNELVIILLTMYTSIRIKNDEIRTSSLVENHNSSPKILNLRCITLGLQMQTDRNSGTAYKNTTLQQDF